MTEKARVNTASAKRRVKKPTGRKAKTRSAAKRKVKKPTARKATARVPARWRWVQKTARLLTCTLKRVVSLARQLRMAVRIIQLLVVILHAPWTNDQPHQRQ
jgi:hypothetical protein